MLITNKKMSTVQPTYDELVSAAVSSTMSLLSNASEQELKASCVFNTYLKINISRSY
jgi:hypothetical protein